MDKNRARLEDFIIRFQAGEEKRVVSEGVAPLLSVLFSLQEVSGQEDLQGAGRGEEQSGHQDPGPLPRPQGAQKLQEEKVEGGDQRLQL